MKKELQVKELQYQIRSAEEKDAKQLSEVRLQVDGETENMDRERGEGFIDEEGFVQIIRNDSISKHNLFLVAEVKGKIAGFSRCEGSSYKRLSHKVDFGICVLKEFWGFGIGKNLLKETINWADQNEIHKIALHVLETNETAISLYKKWGFEEEGILRNDKRLSDGKFYNTIVMGRWMD